jgi:predicted dehydrogenase
MNHAIDVGMVGAGIISETHCDVLAQWPSVALIFVVDPNPDASVSFKNSAPPRYDTVTDALGGHDPDLVVVASPTQTHAAIVREVLTGSNARVLVEKPMVHDLAALADLLALAPGVDLRSRLFVAHHFAFSPEVMWAADQIAANPEWGPVTRATCAFHDPYILRGEQAFASYVSSWIDSGSNQLSMLTRFVEFRERESFHETAGGATAWSTLVTHTGDDTTGLARLFTSWQTGTSSKRTTLELARTGVEIWLDHTAMTGFAVRDGQLLTTCVNDGLTPRKISHYQPLYQSLLSDHPDPVMGIDTATTVAELLAGARI